MTDNINLPPLPEWMCDFQIPADDQDDSDFNWLDWRMKEYARAAVLADREGRDALLAERDSLEAECAEQARLNGMGAGRETALIAQHRTDSKTLREYAQQRDDFAKAAIEAQAERDAAREERDALRKERDALRDAAKQLADWCEHEVGAEPDLTPGLAEVRAALAQHQGEKHGNV